MTGGSEQRARNRAWPPAHGGSRRWSAAGKRAHGHDLQSSFQNRRNLTGWIDLVPKQNLTEERNAWAVSSKAGNRYLRQMFVVGAMAVIRYAERHGTRRPWLSS